MLHVPELRPPATVGHACGAGVRPSPRGTVVICPACGVLAPAGARRPHDRDESRRVVSQDDREEAAELLEVHRGRVLRQLGPREGLELEAIPLWRYYERRLWEAASHDALRRLARQIERATVRRFNLSEPAPVAAVRTNDPAAECEDDAECEDLVEAACLACGGSFFATSADLAASEGSCPCCGAKGSASPVRPEPAPLPVLRPGTPQAPDPRGDARGFVRRCAARRSGCKEAGTVVLDAMAPSAALVADVGGLPVTVCETHRRSLEAFSPAAGWRVVERLAGPA